MLMKVNRVEQIPPLGRHLEAMQSEPRGCCAFDRLGIRCPAACGEVAHIIQASAYKSQNKRRKQAGQASTK